MLTLGQAHQIGANKDEIRKNIENKELWKAHAAKLEKKLEMLNAPVKPVKRGKKVSRLFISAKFMLFPVIYVKK